MSLVIVGMLVGFSAYAETTTFCGVRAGTAGNAELLEKDGSTVLVLATPGGSQALLEQADALILADESGEVGTQVGTVYCVNAITNFKGEALKIIGAYRPADGTLPATCKSNVKIPNLPGVGETDKWERGIQDGTKASTNFVCAGETNSGKSFAMRLCVTQTDLTSTNGSLYRACGPLELFVNKVKVEKIASEQIFEFFMDDNGTYEIHTQVKNGAPMSFVLEHSLSDSRKINLLKFSTAKVKGTFHDVKCEVQ